jgi:hypothetical protein
MRLFKMKPAQSPKELWESGQRGEAIAQLLDEPSIDAGVRAKAVADWVYSPWPVADTYSGGKHQACIFGPKLGLTWFQCPPGAAISGARPTVELGWREAYTLQQSLKAAVDDVIDTFLKRREEAGCPLDLAKSRPERDRLTQAEIETEAAAWAHGPEPDDETTVRYHWLADGRPGRCRLVQAQIDDCLFVAWLDVFDGGVSPNTRPADFANFLLAQGLVNWPAEAIRWFSVVRPGDRSPGYLTEFDLRSEDGLLRLTARRTAANAPPAFEQQALDLLAKQVALEARGVQP